MITLHKYDISATIKDRYTNIVYSFDFENKNLNGSNELRFEITIDPDSFISKFDANIDGQIFHGITKEKEEASKEYNEAKEKDENAILIYQPHENIPNVFEIKTNIDSKSKILLNLTIEQYLQKKFKFNINTIQILRNFAKYNIAQNFDSIPFKFDVEDQSGIYDVDIPMINDEDIIIDQKIMDKQNQSMQIIGKINKKSSLNEIILKYKIKGESNESHILYDIQSNTFCHVISDLITDSMIYHENDINEGQNDEIKENILIPRRVVFVIDKSGSMSGTKWNKTISSTITAIKHLRKSYDRYCIILFNSNIEILPYDYLTNSNRCILADDTNISDSIESLENKPPFGSTNINDALLTAINLIKNDMEILNNNNDTFNFFMNQIIFITDGEPNYGIRDTKQIITNIKNANNGNSKISIFSFGVGNDGNDSLWINDLNHSFLKVLSLNNNGFYKRIKQTSADTLFNEYFTILSKPILSNICIVYNNKNVTALTQTKFNTLYCGNDLIVCGKINNNNNKDFELNVSISAITGKNIKQNDRIITKPIRITKQIKININTENLERNNNAERIWAYLTLQQYAKNRLIHNDMIEIDDDEKKDIAAIPLSLAMKYKFITPWTSMIVVQQNDDNTDDIVDNLSKHQYDPHQKVNSNLKKKQHKKRTKSLMLLQNDLFLMTITTVFRNLEEEGIWIIDDFVREKFNAKTMYELALKEDIPWRQWNQWLRQKIVKYLQDNNLMKNKKQKTQSNNMDILENVNIAQQPMNTDWNNLPKPSDYSETYKQITNKQDDEECLMM